ncbi:MAG: carboxymuconolactone decarboxylase family protein [Planctomycetota bacterium]|nr:carboxymuconolactone decarboxylase family protein [Planctomycetota bacterium]
MTSFQLHTLESAPESAKPILAGAEQALGFVPNLYATMADAPALLEGYTTLAKVFDKSALSATERQIVLLAVSFENDCDYCMAAHTAISGMQKVPGDVVAALRDGMPLADAKLEALRAFTRGLVQARGFAQAGDVQALLDAGYTRSTVLEVILGVGLKTMSNFTNHVAKTPLDDAFEPVKWERPAGAAV